MERDFLAAIGKDAAREESSTEPGYVGLRGAPAMQWPFPSKFGAAPPLMPYKLEPKELVFDQFSLSGFRPAPPVADALDGSKKQASPVLTSQRPFNGGNQGHHALHGELHLVSNGARVVPSGLHHSAVFNPGNQMFKVQSSPNLPSFTGNQFKQQPFTANSAVAGCTVGVYGPRDLPKPKAAQLTIFYAGSVNVFDNVPVEKAQELMLLASRSSIPSAANASHRPDSTVFTPAVVAVPEVLPAKQMLVQKQDHVVPPVSHISSPISVVSQAVTLPGSTSIPKHNTEGRKSADPLVVPPTSQPSPSLQIPVATTTAAAIMPRAVPQARKASLARFLEKRKERVATVVPYPSSKSPLESSDTLGSANAQSKSSCTDIALSSNHDESLSLGQPRNISFSEDSPSTKLQI